MSREDRTLLRQFYRILDNAVRACYKRDGRVDLETVCEEMEKDSEYTLSRLAPKFGRQYMRILTQKRLKRMAMNNGHSRVTERAAMLAAQEDQLELEIEDIEQFRGVPISISLEDPERPGHIIYIPFMDSLREHRKLSLQLLDQSIRADQNKRQLQAKGTQFADFLADRYGDLPVKELIKLWRADGCPGFASGGAAF